MLDATKDIQQLAMYMQARDARLFEVQDINGDFQTWDGIGEMGQSEYLTDASAFYAAMRALGYNKNND